MAAERLQKILARAGIASRRAAEQLILAGRVRVNGRIVDELGAKAVASKCPTGTYFKQIRSGETIVASGCVK